MTVIQLNQYLEGLCYEGKQHNRVLFSESPFTSELIPVAAFSHGEESVTLTRASPTEIPA